MAVGTQAAVQAFLGEKTLAIAGISRGGRKFGNTIFRNLRGKGYRLLPIHPQAETIDGEKCSPDIASLPEKVGGLITVVPPAETERLVREAAAAGIERIWMQQGSESPAAIAFCADNGIEVVAGHCILMFAEPTGFGHRLHRGVWRLLGLLPR
jgi:uncharacterized protein